MKVLYDNQVFDGQRIGGISRYFSILASELPKQGVDVAMGLLATRNVYMHDTCPLRWLGFMRKHNEAYSKFLMRHTQYDVYHPTYYFTHMQRHKHPQVPMVVTVHDLIQERFRAPGAEDAALEQIRQEKARIVAAADRLIAISENTKRDMIDVWGVDEKKIDVIYHGLMWSENLLATPAALPFTGGYLLFVGDRKAEYKNFKEFIVAASQVVKKYGLNIVCTGHPFSPAEMEFLKQYGVDNLTHSFFVDEGTLLWLYRNAACFVFPSCYEGFGIPILEAFKASCPTILANASCFPEIGGNAVEYYEPDHPDSLVSKLTLLLDDSEHCDALRKAGQERLSQFGIEKMATATKECYKRAVGK